MDSTALFAAAGVLVATVGAAAWAWLALARVDVALQSFPRFEETDFEVHRPSRRNH
jgi:hypothetical protein